MRIEEISLNDFNGLVYHYGANGTKSIEGLNQEQQEIIYLAWARSEAIENEKEADNEINSYYKDFLKAGSKVEKKYIGYGYHGGGRPSKGEEAKRKTVSISGAPAEIEQLKKMASEKGLTLSRFVIDSLIK